MLLKYQNNERNSFISQKKKVWILMNCLFSNESNATFKYLINVNVFNANITTVSN